MGVVEYNQENMESLRRKVQGHAENSMALTHEVDQSLNNLFPHQKTQESRMGAWLSKIRGK